MLAEAVELDKVHIILMHFVELSYLYCLTVITQLTLGRLNHLSYLLFFSTLTISVSSDFCLLDPFKLSRPFNFFNQLRYVVQFVLLICFC